MKFENVLVFYIKYDCPSISILLICLHRRIYFLCITFDLLFHLSFWIHHRQRAVSKCRCSLIKTKLYKIDPVGNRKIWNIMIQTQFSLIGYRLDSMKFQKPCEFFLDLNKTILISSRSYTICSSSLNIFFFMNISALRFVF